ncbi:uncharacterized protein L969DRAFT_90292 [Mixia osmundae IAM 14324]|uniref:uncharacterized protein n=1 Tax=Mixia osmundae (strain CBS 9802 / IAM 14324 / JCM 22182 / KY 12970) TaxID=764103 RepID=UPI0004A55540|nr:uncharacterized protein L969DRAFT_90292 [Mixia osmundae IAM 14324]KEI37220.1 hypothetical protein L969DRAFT_90292 [Mixia osmundae IAM 14324]
MVAPATKPAGLSAIPPQNIGSGLTTEDAARLLRSQPKHYVVARLYARNYLLTEGDQLTVPLLRIKPPQIAYKPQPSQPQGGVVPVGKKIRLHGIVEVGSRDYTLRAPEVLPSSADGTQIMPFVARRTASGTLDPQRVYVEAIVTEHTKSKMETLLKKKRRKNYQRTIKSKHDWTRLRITKIEVTMPGGAIAQRSV